MRWLRQTGEMPSIPSTHGVLLELFGRMYTVPTLVTRSVLHSWEVVEVKQMFVWYVHSYEKRGLRGQNYTEKISECHLNGRITKVFHYFLAKQTNTIIQSLLLKLLTKWKTFLNSRGPCWKFYIQKSTATFSLQLLNHSHTILLSWYIIRYNFICQLCTINNWAGIYRSVI